MKRLYLLFICTIILLISSFSTNHNVSATNIQERIVGKDRFEVAVNVSKKGWGSSANTVVLANYNAFADALAAAPLAYKYNGPILLTQSNKLTEATKREITRLKPSNVIIVGGEASVSNSVWKELESMNIANIWRLGGKDRFEVAYYISRELGNTDTAIVANGLNFPDALAIAPYAARNGFPILLTGSNNLPEATRKALSEKNITKTTIVGGEASVGKRVADQLPRPYRIGGKDRFEVAANIIKQLNLSAEKAYLATGLTFADALTGSVLAAKENAPLLLTHSKSASQATQAIIKEKQVQNLIILGGQGSVPDTVAQKLVSSPSRLPLEGKRIVLDSGHGGSDPGAVNGQVYEKHLNMQFTTKLARKLTDMGATVIYTIEPNNDRFMSLADRADFANRQNADLFISIHHDSNVNKSLRGLSTHYSSYRPGIETQDVYVLSGGQRYEFVREITDRKVFVIKDGNTQREISYVGNNIAYDTISPSQAARVSADLAPKFAQALASDGIANSYTKDHNLYVTRWTTMPSILIELGFMSNDAELSILRNENIQDKRAQSLANEIRTHFE